MLQVTDPDFVQVTHRAPDRPCLTSIAATPKRRNEHRTRTKRTRLSCRPYTLASLSYSQNAHQMKVWSSFPSSPSDWERRFAIAFASSAARADAMSCLGGGFGCGLFGTGRPSSRAFCCLRSKEKDRSSAIIPPLRLPRDPDDDEPAPAEAPPLLFVGGGGGGRGGAAGAPDDGIGGGGGGGGGTAPPPTPGIGGGGRITCGRC